jgi:putative FmdB family regulatory protein
VALYEYRCATGHSIEIFHRMDETPTVVCDECGSKAERVLSMPMIHTQYYFSPQVQGANRPRHKPSSEKPLPTVSSPEKPSVRKSSAEKPSGKKPYPKRTSAKKY